MRPTVNKQKITEDKFMKTITIPTYNNPFIVVINNKVYQYKGGETIEVPDDVAEAIEDAIELIPKPKRYLSKFAQFVEGSLTEIGEGDLEGITTISPYAFYRCSSLTSIAISDGVKSVGNYAFSMCTKLENITIPNGLTSIGNYAFSNCSKIECIIIPDSIKNIDVKAFDSCTKLARVIVKALTPPSIQTESLSGIPSTCVFEVPLEAVEAYKSAPYWSTYASQIKAIEE